MLTTSLLISCWYDFEAVRDLTVYCDCGTKVPEEAMEELTEKHYVCGCGRITKLADLDKLADALESPVPHS